MRTPSPFTLIGGRWAFSWQAWGLSVLLAETATLAWFGRIGEVSLVGLALASLLGALASGIVLVVADRVLRSRRERPVAPLLVIGIWSLAYVVRFVVADTSTEALVGVTVERPLVRMVASTISLVGWTWVATYYLALGDYYRNVSTDLAAASARLRALGVLRRKDLDHLRTTLVVGVESSILPALQALEQQLEDLDDEPSQQELLRLAETTDIHARRLVRSISHQVSDGAMDPSLAAAFEDGPDTLAVPSPSPPWRVSTFWGPALASVSAIPLALSFGGTDLLVRALAGIAPWALALLVLGRAQRPFMHLLPISSVGYVVVANAGALALGIVGQARLTTAYFGDQKGPALIGFWLALALAQLIATAMGHSLAGLRRDSETLAEQNRELSELTARLESEVEPLRRQVAHILHGPVQGRLAAVALTLRLQADAQRAGMQPDGRRTVARCRALLELVNRDIEAMRRGEVGSSTPITARLELLCRRWTGLVSVQSSVSDAASTLIDTGVINERRISLIVEEAINNACTHGRARNVEVWVDVAEDGRVCVEVTDDGTGPPPGVRAGLGLGAIPSMGGTWRLVTGPRGGAVLTVRVPMVAIDEPGDGDVEQRDGGIDSVTATAP